MKQFLFRFDRPLIPIIVIAIYLFFYRLGATTLTNWDEAWFASVAQDQVTRRDFFTGYWNGQVWMYEPPLVTFMLAGVMALVGPTEFWLRAINATSGLIIVILTYWLGKKVTGSRLAGGLSSLILLSDIEFLFRSRQINVEIPLTLLLLLSVCLIIVTFRAHVRMKCDKSFHCNNSIRILLAALTLALAFLTKRASPALALPAVIYILTRSAGWRGRIIFLITFIAVIFPWHVYSYLKWGNQFINEYFLGYTLGKIKAANSDFGTSYLFYFQSLKHAFKYWAVLLPFSTLWALRGLIRRINPISLIGPMYITISIFVATFFILLTLAPIKASWYLLPIHPLLAILIGSFLANLMSHSRKLAVVIIGLTVFIAGWQLVRWRYEYLVPDTTSHQAKLAMLAHEESVAGETIYLDDDYLPVAVFYSQRKIEALRFNRLITQKPSLTQLPVGSLVMSNTETIDVLKNTLANPIDVLTQESDLLLVKVLPPISP